MSSLTPADQGSFIGFFLSLFALPIGGLAAIFTYYQIAPKHEWLLPRALSCAVGTFVAALEVSLSFSIGLSVVMQLSGRLIVIFFAGSIMMGLVAAVAHYLTFGMIEWMQESLSEPKSK